MTTCPSGYGRLAPAGLACAAIVCGGLLWLASGSAPVAGAAFQPSLHLRSANSIPDDGAVWLQSSADDASSPDDDDDAPAAGAAIVTAQHSTLRDDQAWEPVALEETFHAGTDPDSHSLRGPPALADDHDPSSTDDDDEDDGDQDDAIAEFITAPDLSTPSIDLADAAMVSAPCVVCRSHSLRAPPVSAS